MPKAPENCPHCGADIPLHAEVCPQCGSDAQTGWSEEAKAQELGLPDEKFDYADFVEGEFGGGERTRPRGVAWYWWVLAAVLVAGFVTLLLWR
ncbi:MAG: zinc-ribbon domain-containing protein [Verrucomicrobia bacterium]|nr:zinc-ribbon domain-containing protein [Verrucomicrobiota bacterium]